MAGTDVFIQALLILIAVISVVFLQSLPKRILSQHRRRRLNHPSSCSAQSHRHFITGAQSLARACSRSPPSLPLLRSALASADLAISLEPRDAAPHLLKALTLHLLDRPIPAIKCLNAALSLPAVKTLGTEERADALVKRAELQLAVSKRRKGVELAIRDLEEAVKVKRAGKTMVMLGECYEMKGMKEEARRAFVEALEVDEELEEAKKGLERVNAASKVVVKSSS